MISIKFRKTSSPTNQVLHLEFSEEKTRKINIGRAPGNHVILPGKTVSREHACIDIREERAFIRDLNSANGIYMRMGMELRKIKKSILVTGDRLAIGEYVLDIEVNKDGVSATSEHSQSSTLIDLIQMQRIAAVMFSDKMEDKTSVLGKADVFQFPSSVQVRALIYAILRTDSQLEAFMMDYYPHIHRMITPSMDKIAKINLLLSAGDEFHRLEIAQNLEQAYPNEYKQYGQMTSDPVQSL